MIKEGDGPQDQPAEGVTLNGLAEMMGEDSGAPDESDESEESGESEEVEASGESEESDDDADSDEAEDDDTATFTLKHEGKEVTVKKSEVIELAQKGFDYTNKTMAVAEKDKAVAAKLQEAEGLAKQRRDAVMEQIARLEAVSQLAQAQLGEPPPIELATQNAAQYLALKHAHESQEGKLRQAYTEIKALREQADRERHTALIEEAQATERALVDTLPGWKDAPKERLAEIHAYLTENGLTPENVPEAYVKKGLWEIARKAREFDRLQEAKAQIKTKPAQTPRVNKPSTSSNQPPQLAAHSDRVKAHKARPTLDSLANLL